MEPHGETLRLYRHIIHGFVSSFYGHLPSQPIWGRNTTQIPGTCFRRLRRDRPRYPSGCRSPFRFVSCASSVGRLFFLLVWTLLILAMIRNFSGAGWGGDWLEHFQRSLFFLLHFPVSTPITQGYQLPARPPAMNELAAFFLAQTRDRFEVFQVIFAFLNLLMFLPCCLIMRALVAPRRTFVLPLTALFAMNPVVIQSATYTWTKAFTAFYVILGIWFYLAAWRKNDFVRMTVAFVALSMGVLAHYSAAPYLLFLTLHYLLRLFWKRPHRFRELATIAVVSGLLLATWFGWSIGVYGAHGTFAAASQRYEGNSLSRGWRPMCLIPSCRFFCGTSLSCRTTSISRDSPVLSATRHSFFTNRMPSSAWGS